MPQTAALQHLAARDPKLAGILTGPPFKAYRHPDLYRDLLESIVSQQLSIKAAATIFARFLALFPGRQPTPRRVLALPEEKLRAAGLSRQKAGYLRNVAAFALHHDVSRAALRRLGDDEVIALLTQIKGVGRWTAEMLLMFPLDRPDVLPLDDLGIQLAMKKLYGLRGHGRGLHRRMAALAEAWRPHRTLACKYLWRWRSTQR
jgi:DNA-3-methyladenine glycosylase II